MAAAGGAGLASDQDAGGAGLAGAICSDLAGIAVDGGAAAGGVAGLYALLREAGEGGGAGRGALRAVCIYGDGGLVPLHVSGDAGRAEPGEQPGADLKGGVPEAGAAAVEGADGTGGGGGVGGGAGGDDAGDGACAGA